ncbi:MAG TPA: hypothetical protein VFG81_07775 [Anaerolineales bacterium]|jgi:hypothetical protein|nr:hypothetical protein [Anaerolineales bacterium]
MVPIVALESDGKTVAIASAFHVSMADLTKARGRVKDDKYRLMTLDAPQTTKLASAVHKGICQTISLFTQEPPRGTRQLWLRRL